MTKTAPLKLLIYSHAFAPKIGGVETYVMLLAEGLARESAIDVGNVHVTVVTPTAADAMNDSALPFRVVRQPGILQLLKLLWDSNVVHLAGPCLFPMMIGLALRRPVVVEHHGYQAVCPNGLLFFEPSKTVCPGHFIKRQYGKCLRCNGSESGFVSGLTRLILTFPRRLACKLVTLNVPISQHLRDRLALPRSSVIYYGICGPLETEHSLSDTQNKIPSYANLAYVGRLVREKGVSVLLRAASQLRNSGYRFSLKIIGDGPERPELEELAIKLDLRDCLHFTGWLQGHAFKSALEDVSVLLMATLMEETAGLAAIEQMMRGRLVIVSDIGGLGEVVDGAGLKFEPGNVTALASCIQHVLEDPRMAARLGAEAALRAAELFTQQRMVNDHVKVFRWAAQRGVGN